MNRAQKRTLIEINGNGLCVYCFCRPKSGSMLLYSRKKVRYRRDGYCWKKRKDGKTTREDHMKLKVQGTEVSSIYIFLVTFLYVLSLLLIFSSIFCSSNLYHPPLSNLPQTHESAQMEINSKKYNNSEEGVEV